MARQFAKAFYNSKEWKRVRSYVLMRDHYRCQKCGRPAEEVHHKIHLNPVNIWDMNVSLNPDNLICLCKDCHFGEHRWNVDITGEGYEFDEFGQLVPMPPVEK